MSAQYCLNCEEQCEPNLYFHSFVKFNILMNVVTLYLPCGMEFVDVILDHKALTDEEGASLKTFNERRVTGYETSDGIDTKLSGMRTG